jgi:hypothetical protein
MQRIYTNPDWAFLMILFPILHHYQSAMLFGKKRPVTVTFIDAQSKVVIGQDQISAKLIPVDFDYPTMVEIDGDRYELKAADPASRAEAQKMGSMTVWLELTLNPASKANAQEEDEEEKVAEVQGQSSFFRTASLADPQPRFTGQRGVYRFQELLPSDWRQVEFVQRVYAPEVGEELSHIADVQETSQAELDGRRFYNEQHVRLLTSLPLRTLELDDIAIQTRFFPLATRLDGVSIMGGVGYVHAGFAYRLHSGISFYGQEIDQRLRNLGFFVPPEVMKADGLAEDIQAIATMMKTLGLILIDWDRLEAVEADATELTAYLQVGA